MAKTLKNKDIGILVRKLFQEMLKEHLKTGKDRTGLARALGISESAVNGMIYRGSGGLDVWVNALAAYYPINEKVIKNLKTALKKEYRLNESDKIWHNIPASEKEKLKLAKIAATIYETKNTPD